MGLFDEKKQKISQYRTDVEFLCRCDGKQCDQPHHPERYFCLAKELAGLFTVFARRDKREKQRWYLCAGCLGDLRSNGVKVATAYPGSNDY